MIKIEKNIKVPCGSHTLIKYPFGEMDVGDSILIGSDTEKHTARSAVFSYARMNRKKFVTRSVDGGLRVWRTE